MSYEERVARREDEIESLKKALCVLSAYAELSRRLVRCLLIRSCRPHRRRCRLD